MRKLIDLPDTLIKKLKLVAAYRDKDVKNHLQDIIVDEVEKQYDAMTFDKRFNSKRK